MYPSRVKHKIVHKVSSLGGHKAVLHVVQEVVSYQGNQHTIVDEAFYEFAAD